MKAGSGDRRIFLAAAALLIAGTAGVGWMRRDRFRYPPYPAPAVQGAQPVLLGGFAPESLEPRSDIELRALVRAPTGPARGWLVFLAGNGDGVLASGQEFLKAVDPGPAWGLVALPYRGFDNVGGEPSLRNFRSDLQAWWRHLGQRHGVRAESTHLLAFSLGTALALELAQQLQREGAALASITLLGAYDQIEVAPAGWWATWGRADRYDALGFATAIASPVLLVHGSDDAAVPLEGVRRLARAIGPRANLLEMAGGNHVTPLQDARSRAAVRDFVVGASLPVTGTPAAAIQSRGA